MRTNSLIAFLAALALAAGCGGDKPTDPGTPSGGGSGTAAPAGGAAAGGAAGQWDAAKATATVKGVAKFKGTPPTRKPIDMGTEKTCHDHHGGNALEESVIVGAGGALKNVFVSVTSGLDAYKFPAPAAPISLNQVGCTYAPHVQGMVAGQSIDIKNSDPVLHNIHSLAKVNENFNFGQPKQGATDTKTFKRPEIVKIKCDVHGWMNCYIHVVKHPFFATTGDSGAFELPKLAPGTYTIEAWHEEFGKLPAQSITIGAGETKELTFEFEG